MKVNVRKAPAGSALDAACAEAMGCETKVWRFNGRPFCTCDGNLHGFDESMSRMIPLYSEHIKRAWELVEAMKERGYWCQIRTPFRTGGDYWCGFTPYECSGWNGQPDYWTNADTAPLAICRAFLLANGVEEVEVEEER